MKMKLVLAALAHAYDDVLAKYAPVLVDADDGPQNQIESKPRIEALPVESETEVTVHKMLAAK